MSRGTFSIIADSPPYRTYFIGQLISLIGTWMQSVAQSWVVVTLTHSTAAIATIAFVASIPMLLLSMPAGVLADTRDRRKILIITQLLFAALAFAYAALYATGHLTLLWIYILAVLLSAVMAFDFPALQALAPELVPPPRIPEAVALGQSLMHGTRLIGPAVAGLVMGATSPAMVFLINGVSYFAVIYSLAIIRVPEHQGHPRKKGEGGLGAAIRYVREQKVVRACLGYVALATSFMFPLFIIFGAVFIRDVLHGESRHFAMLMMASGAGALTGALLLGRVPAELRGRGMLIASVAGATALAVQSLSTNVYVAIGVQSLLTFCVSIGMGLSTTIIQVTVPNELRGRVMALNGIMFVGVMPTSALLLGALGEVTGLRIVMRLCAVAFGLTTIAWLIAAGLAKRQVGEAVPPAVTDRVPT